MARTVRSPLHVRLRRRAAALVVETAFEGIAKGVQWLPIARPARHGVERIRDIPYRSTGRREHLLDIYRPIARDPSSRLPIVLYVHGGAFCTLSKDTHWSMGLAFARRGYLVFNVNYRLAPRHRYPAALEDVGAAYGWIVREAMRFGGDPSQLIFAGESAGANLVTALAIATSYRRKEPWAQSIFAVGAPAMAALPACGIFKVTDPGRFTRRRTLPMLTRDLLTACCDAYLPPALRIPGADAGLADPLVILERGHRPDRPLPAFHVICGTRDPLLDDSRRLHAALDAIETPCELRVFPGEPHAFHALVWRPAARDAWRGMYRFLSDLTLPCPLPPSQSLSSAKMVFWM